MIENLTLYLPTNKPSLKKYLPQGNHDGGFLRAPSFYEFPSDSGLVKLSFMNKTELPDHLTGFKGYVAQLENNDNLKKDAYLRINKTRSVLGVSLSKSIALESSTFKLLERLTWAEGGFIFVSDSILTSEGFAVGPATYPEAIMKPIAEVKINSDTQPVPEHLQEMRDRNLQILKAANFKCADWMPIGHNDTLRPAEEIARRFAALAALFIYVVAPENEVSEKDVRSVICNQKLETAMTEEEKTILILSRDDANKQHSNSIGWKTENIWPLAWVFGFKPDPKITSGQLMHEDILALLKFAPPRDQSIEQFVLNHPTKPVEEIIQLEDQFYCAHNAVRSAQLGHPTTPKNFHPASDGGVIHERRHALTWPLSPGVEWDDTDLST